jgi:hypothetical protein
MQPGYNRVHIYTYVVGNMQSGHNRVACRPATASGTHMKRRVACKAQLEGLTGCEPLLTTLRRGRISLGGAAVRIKPKINVCRASFQQSILSTVHMLMVLTMFPSAK